MGDYPRGNYSDTGAKAGPLLFCWVCSIFFSLVVNTLKIGIFHIKTWISGFSRFLTLDLHSHFIAISHN